ncbi:hypothetical protein LY76DRAFT_47771 [Colletotrichum caudatum]|nr:hypothetical protein LY76DRAFT_47771 [Colletotrichum caudatum]
MLLVNIAPRFQTRLRSTTRSCPYWVGFSPNIALTKPSWMLTVRACLDHILWFMRLQFHRFIPTFLFLYLLFVAWRRGMPFSLTLQPICRFATGLNLAFALDVWPSALQTTRAPCDY